MMKTKFLTSILSFIILFSGNIFAQEYPSGSLLWRVSGNGLEKPSYLLGTLHLETGEYLNKISGAIEAMDVCEQFVGELDVTNMMSVQQQMMPGMMMPSDTSYKMLYSEEEYQFVSKQLATFLGVGLDQLGILKPSALQTTVTAMIFQKSLPDFTVENALDIVIQKTGIAKGKPILALETVTDQVDALFNASSLRRQADLLLCALQEWENLEEGIKDILKLIDDYHNGDLNALYFESFQKEDTPCPLTPEEKNKLLKDRNDKWMEKLPAIIKDKSSFIAVGALHLAGEEGLLHRLQQAGYNVEAVK